MAGALPTPFASSLSHPGLQEYQLKELAYAIFLSCASAQASPGLLADLRASLELNETRAAELQRITTLVGQHGITSLASLEMHIRLLQVCGGGGGGGLRSWGAWVGGSGGRVRLTMRAAGEAGQGPGGMASAVGQAYRLSGLLMADELHAWLAIPTLRATCSSAPLPHVRADRAPLCL